MVVIHGARAGTGWAGTRPPCPARLIARRRLASHAVTGILARPARFPSPRSVCSLLYVVASPPSRVNPAASCERSSVALLRPAQMMGTASSQRRRLSRGIRHLRSQVGPQYSTVDGVAECEGKSKCPPDQVKHLAHRSPAWHGRERSPLIKVHFMQSTHTRVPWTPTKRIADWRFSLMGNEFDEWIMAANE